MNISKKKLGAHCMAFWGENVSKQAHIVRTTGRLATAAHTWVFSFKHRAHVASLCACRHVQINLVVCNVLFDGRNCISRKVVCDNFVYTFNLVPVSNRTQASCRKGLQD